MREMSSLTRVETRIISPLGRIVLIEPMEGIRYRCDSNRITGGIYTQRWDHLMLEYRTLLLYVGAFWDGMPSPHDIILIATTPQGGLASEVKHHGVTPATTPEVLTNLLTERKPRGRVGGGIEEETVGEGDGRRHGIAGRCALSPAIPCRQPSPPPTPSSSISPHLL